MLPSLAFTSICPIDTVPFSSVCGVCTMRVLAPERSRVLIRWCPEIRLLVRVLNTTPDRSPNVSSEAPKLSNRLSDIVRGLYFAGRRFFVVSVDTVFGSVIFVPFNLYRLVTPFCFDNLAFRVPKRYQKAHRHFRV